MWDKSSDRPQSGDAPGESAGGGPTAGRPPMACEHVFACPRLPLVPFSAPVRRAPRALRVLVPRRGVVCPLSSPSRLANSVPGDGAHRSRLRRGGDGVRACGPCGGHLGDPGGGEITVRRRAEPAVPSAARVQAATHAGGATLAAPACRSENDHLTLLVEVAPGGGASASSSRARTRTLAIHPQRERTEHSVTLEGVAEHAEGLICLTGCAPRASRTSSARRVLREAFGADRLRVELHGYARDDRMRIRGRRRLAGRACRSSSPATCTRMIVGGPTSRMRSSPPGTAEPRCQRGPAPWQPQHVLVAPEVMARASGGSRRGSRKSGARRALHRVRSHAATSATATRGDDPSMIRTLRGRLRGRLRGSLPRAAATSARPPAARRGAPHNRPPRARRVLRPAP